MNKLTKDEYDALPSWMKSMFKKDGDDYVLSKDPSGDDEDNALKRAIEHERAEKATLKAELKALREAKEADDDKKAKDKGDIDAINASWQKKLDKANADKDAVIAARENSLKTLLVTNEAQRIANEVSTDPHLLIPIIERRLQADFSEDGKATTRVVDKDGKLSALSLDEFKNEILADKSYSRILKGSGASGGGASGGGGEGGAFDIKQYRNADGTTDWAKVNAGMKNDPGLLDKVRQANGTSPPSTEGAGAA